MPVLKDEEYKNFIGPPNTESYHEYFRLFGEKLEEAASLHKCYATGKGASEAFAFAGINELCSDLKQKGILQAVATLKLQESAEKVIEYLDLTQVFYYIVGADLSLQKKADVIEKCISLAGADKKNAILIGDSIYDQIGAYECGVDFIGVTYGFGFKHEEEMKKYPYVYAVNSVGKLRELF